jgi:hypothetical protein
MLGSTLKNNRVRLACQAYVMSDAGLASLIGRIARDGSRQIEELTEIPDEKKLIIVSKFKDVLLEVSARLYEKSGVPTGFRRHPDFKALSEADVRAVFLGMFQSNAFYNIGTHVNAQYSEALGATDLQIATCPATNGNVVLIALDRISVPDMKNESDIRSSIMLTASLRGTSSPDGCWIPEMSRSLLEDPLNPLPDAVIEQIIAGEDDLDLLDVEDQQDQLQERDVAAFA